MGELLDKLNAANTWHSKHPTTRIEQQDQCPFSNETVVAIEAISLRPRLLHSDTVRGSQSNGSVGNPAGSFWVSVTFC